MPRILILTDYRGTFYSTVRTIHALPSMDVKQLAASFRTAGYDPEVVRYADLDLSADWRGVPVLYTSSEDTGLEYKGWLEDLVLALETAGARTLPSYRFLRAHHNKVMMEALRTQLWPTDASRLGSRSFGTYEELEAAVLDDPWPKVIKASEGAGSLNVALAHNRAELLTLARRISRTRNPDETIREHGKRILRRGRHYAKSLHRQKFVVQNLIPGLEGDFKVLRFGDRFYTMWRHNRPGDFRASGSGRFDFDGTGGVDRGALLDYAEQVSDTLGTPTASMDIGFDGERFHVIEFQCLHFGTVAAERSSRYFTRDGGSWRAVEERCDIEAVFSDAILQFIESQPADDGQGLNVPLLGQRTHGGLRRPRQLPDTTERRTERANRG